jgi:di/tricarboxylate transporter
MKNTFRKYLALVLLIAVSASLVVGFMGAFGNYPNLNTNEIRKQSEVADKSKVLARIPLFFMGSYALIQKFTNKSSER